jgi:alkylated DNA nucleotide flippase Atl1
MAQQVGAGEWTTYGDIALAVHGDVRAAREVGWAAAKYPAFPNAHRVLKAGGLIAAGWRDHQGRGPEECQRLLEAEGIAFTGDRADPQRHVPAHVLFQRVSSG